MKYEAAAADPAVFFKLFNVPADFKKKIVKIPLTEFESKVLKCWMRAKGPWGSTFSLTGGEYDC